MGNNIFGFLKDPNGMNGSKCHRKPGAYLGGAFGGPGPPGHQRGAKKIKKKEKGKGKREREREKERERERRGKERGDKKEKRKKVNKHDESGAIQFSSTNMGYSSRVVLLKVPREMAEPMHEDEARLGFALRPGPSIDGLAPGKKTSGAPN